MDKNEIIELEVEEIEQEICWNSISIHYSASNMEQSGNAQAKFNQLNKRKPKDDFSWEELEEIINQNEEDL